MWVDLIVEDRRAAVDQALALAGDEDVVVITGSFFLVGEVRDTLHRNGRWATRTQV